MTRAQVKRKIPRKLGLFGAVIAVGLMVGSAGAFHVGTAAMELDGNVANGAAAGSDWAALFDADGNDTATVDPLGAAGDDIDRDFVVDFVVGASGPDASYHEPSNKDNQPIFAAGASDVWGCRSVSNPLDKDDILNAYAIAYTGQGEDAGDLIISFGVERFDDSGTAYLGFWVFQKDVTCDLATNKFTGSKTDGDILMLANFSNGGDNVSIQALAWHPGTPANSAAGTFTTIGVGVGCDVAADFNPAPPASGVNMCAITNGIGNQNVETPWDTEDKTKPGAPNPDPVNVLEPPEFVEGAINLTDAFDAINQDPPACFGSFMAETRSSDTLTATLKDFALGDLNTCDGSVAITGTATNRIGTPHTFTVTATQSTGGGTVPAATGHATVTLTGSNGIVAGDIDIDEDASTCDDAGDNLNAAGQCTITFNSTETGKITGHVSVAIDLGGGSILTRDTDPSTVTIGAGPDGSETPAIKTYVDATIDITGDGTNRVGAPHSFTATVKTDSGDGNGLVAKVGQLVSIQKVDANGAVSVPAGTQTCTTIAGGVCSVTFTSNTTGTTTGTASATVTVGAISFGITTANDVETAGNESVLKAWVNARIGIVGNDTNSIEEDHTFTVTLEKDPSANGGYVAANGEDVDVTLTDGAGAVHILDTTLTTCDVPAETHDGAGTDANGQCIVVFTSNSAGTVTASATSTLTVQTVQMTVNTGDATSTTAATVLKTFVDGSISWLKHDGDGELLGGATFLVCRTSRLDSSTGLYIPEDTDDVLAGNQPFCWTMVDDDTYDNDKTPGELEVIDLILGEYNVTETIPPPGYHIGTDPGAGPFNFPGMTLDPLNVDVDLTEIFVNVKAFRIIVITCDDIDHTLVVSTVTLADGTPVDSMSAADLASWNLAHGQDVTEAQICGGDVQLTVPSIGGAASFGDLPDGTYGLSVIVPKAS